jgi:hypothetical protein
MSCGSGWCSCLLMQHWHHVALVVGYGVCVCRLAPFLLEHAAGTCCKPSIEVAGLCSTQLCFGAAHQQSQQGFWQRHESRVECMHLACVSLASCAAVMTLQHM